jgi:hypothetical protein
MVYSLSETQRTWEYTVTENSWANYFIIQLKASHFQRSEITTGGIKMDLGASLKR